MVAANTSSYDPKSILDKSIFEFLGLSGASDEKKEALMNEMLAVVDNRVLARVADRLDDQEIKQFQTVMETSEEATNQFLAERNIDMQALYAEETLFYKYELLDAVKGVNMQPVAA